MICTPLGTRLEAENDSGVLMTHTLWLQGYDCAVPAHQHQTEKEQYLSSAPPGPSHLPHVWDQRLCHMNEAFYYDVSQTHSSLLGNMDFLSRFTQMVKQVINA